MNEQAALLIYTQCSMLWVSVTCVHRPVITNFPFKAHLMTHEQAWPGFTRNINMVSVPARSYIRSALQQQQQV